MTTVQKAKEIYRMIAIIPANERTAAQFAALEYYKTQIDFYNDEVEGQVDMYNRCGVIFDELFINDEVDENEITEEAVGKDFCDMIASFKEDFELVYDNESDFIEHLTQWCQIED